MTKLLTLAKQLRSQALSGYDWNAPKRFEDLPDRAKDIWIGKAIREQLAAQAEVGQAQDMAMEKADE